MNKHEQTNKNKSIKENFVLENALSPYLLHIIGWTYIDIALNLVKYNLFLKVALGEYSGCSRDNVIVTSLYCSTESNVIVYFVAGSVIMPIK